MARGVNNAHNPKRIVHMVTESVDPNSLNPMANQVPNSHDPAGLGEMNHNLRLFKNGLHIR